MVLFAAGFVLSLFGSLPPGLISLSVAQTAIQRGMIAAMFLAAGAAGAEFFQAWAAVALSDWFMSHPGAERIFQWAAIPVFTGLGVYLIFWAKPPRSREYVTELSLVRQTVKGIMLSAFNLLAIPYWFAYCSSLRASGVWKNEGLVPTFIFSFGVTIGTLAALGLYAGLGLLIVRRVDSVAHYANRFVGIIFIGLAIKLVVELL